MKILFIDCCISANEESRTEYLCRKYFEKVCNEDDEIVHLKLEGSGIKAMDADFLKKRNALTVKGAPFDDEIFRYAKQFADAERIVIGAPFWDLSFPALLKDYIEQIMVTGITFRYGENGIPQGLCKADMLVYIMTSGGPCSMMNFGYDYVKAIAGMLGIGETRLISAEGLDIEGNDIAAILEETCKNINQ